MKRYSLVLIVLICSVVVSGCLGQKRDNTQTLSTVDQSQIADHSKITIVVADTNLVVEAVTTPASLSQGLGERDSIGSDGMLFFMPERQTAYFWMHGMRFPLDFVWIDQGKIVGIEKQVPAPTDPESTRLPSYSSQQPVTHVLELPAGEVEKLGIQIGMELQISKQE